MKKIVSLVLAMVLALSLAACGKTSVTLDKSEHTFTAAGETVQLTAEVKKADNLGWTSSDASVATVDANGLVTAVAPGTATITVSAGEGVTATCVITCDWTNPVNLLDFYNELYNELYPLDNEGFATGPVAADLMTDPTFTDEDRALMLEMYYPGLGAIEAKQMHVFIPGMSFSAYEVVLIEVVNESDIETVKAMMQARIDAQAAGGAWYPEAVEGWVNNARIVTNGNYIMMAVGADCDTFVDVFNAQF